MEWVTLKMINGLIVERHRFHKPAPLAADFSRFATLDPDLNT